MSDSFALNVSPVMTVLPVCKWHLLADILVHYNIHRRASYPIIGHDLRVYNMQIWLANRFCLAEIQIQMRQLKGVKSPVTGCIIWCVGGLLQCTALPRTNNHGLLHLTWLLIVVGFNKSYCSNIECPIIERFTDHQRVLFSDCIYWSIIYFWPLNGNLQYFFTLDSKWVQPPVTNISTVINCSNKLIFQNSWMFLHVVAINNFFIAL